MLQLDDAVISNKAIGLLRTMSSRAKRYNQENVRLAREGQLVFLLLRLEQSVDFVHSINRNAYESCSET